MKKARGGRALASAAEGATDTRDESRAGGSFPIVGIGASAGGLEAFTALLKHLPIDTGMGFVFVQHLDPQHESALTQLLGRATTMPVKEVTNKLRVEPNHVYVIPRNTNLGITGGVLTLLPRPETRAPHRSIDFFLEALAADQRELAIGVILSGAATDGTVGLEAIKAEGGITFAQDESARYDSMPRSAVAAGCVDFVLSPEHIAHEIARIAKHPEIARAAADGLTRAEDDRASATAHEDDDTPLPSGGTGDPDTGATQARAEAGRDRADKTGRRNAEEGFKKILLLLRNHSGVDFSQYKSSTIQRRITRRLVLTKHDTLDRYAQFLRGNTHELDALYSDVLISVTSFFRNPDAFDVLRHKVLPALLQQGGDDPLRMWVLGCSTGQEAYSLAMSFVEAAEKAPRMRTLQVFATDLNDALLDKARYGLYAKSVAQDLSPERLRRFFVEEEGGYRINKALREMVVFARQNMMSDPPFSRMDLISCRNVLIYLEPGLQKKVFPVFHYALKPGGFLYLGASESIGTFTELFEPVDRKHKLYAKKAAPTPAFQLPARKGRAALGALDSRAIGTPPRIPAEQGGAVEGFRGELNAQREADRVSVNEFAPPAVLITADLQILQFRGPTGAYLEPPTGKASFDVLKMARNGLMLPLRTAINKAKKDNKTVRTDNVRVEQDGTIRTVHLRVIPLKNLRDRCFLIVFDDADRQDPATPETQVARGARRARTSGKAQTNRTSRVGESRRVAEIESDLAETRDYLQAIQEQHEAANEELQASNEEVQSANEELQSINEELETSKEELESANEELTTVNEEMANRNAELNRLNSDLVNVQTSANVAIILLARNLTIRRFSAQAEKYFNLLAADVGRPIGRVRLHLDVPDLDELITDVIDTVRAHEREVRDKEGRWFVLRVRPYLTIDNKVDGAVLVLVDVNDLKRSELAIAAARDYADAVVRTTRDPLVILNADLRVHTANEAFYRTFGVSPSQSEGRLVHELGNQQWNIPRLRELLEGILHGQPVFDEFEVTHDFERLGRRTMLLNGRRLDDGAGQPERILLGIQDVTEATTAQAAVRLTQARNQALIDVSSQIVWTADPSGAVVEDSTSWRAFTGQTLEQWQEFGWLDAIHPDDRARVRQLWLRAVDERTPVDTEYRLRHVSGDWRWTHVRAVPALSPDGTVREWVGMIADVSDRRRADEAQARLAAIVESSDDAIISTDLNAIITSWNAGAERLFGYTAAEAMGQPLTLLIPPERVDEEPAVLARIGRGEVVEQDETVRRRKDGTMVDVSLRVSPILDRQKQVVGTSTIARDITERKKAAETLLEADRHKNEFLAMLAHELRNPLAPILVSIEILRRAKRLEGTESLDLSPRVDHALDVLQRQVGQMVRLVDDLLDAGRISRGKIDLRRERVEVASVVHHAVEAARPIAERRGQKLTVALPTVPVYVNADPTRLAQIVGNLLNNACKFTERDGHIWLTVEREQTRPDHAEASSNGLAPQIVISVRDTGVGIAPDRLEGIFDMFTQLDTSLERSMTGLGIGLTLVRTLVEMHGGTVRASSPGIDQGSEFVVRLPIVTEAAMEAPLSPTTEPAVTPLRILIVDDNRDSADMLATLLKFSGHETHTVHDGMAAVGAAIKLDPDVILLDIGLPQLNGYEAARRIREQASGRRRPVLVALTGWGQDEDRRRSEEAGFDAHVVKPVDHARLHKLLAELGSRSQTVAP